MNRWKSRGGESQRREEKKEKKEKKREEKRKEEGEEERRSEKIKSQKNEYAGAGKGRKVAIHCVFSNDFWLRRVEK